MEHLVLAAPQFIFFPRVNWLKFSPEQPLHPDDLSSEFGVALSGRLRQQISVFSLDFFHDSYQNFARNIDFLPKRFDLKML
ncbi:MAG TPA: hypothetical protein DD000_16905 [Cyanobacteria bacterium UBA11166]|nr:hypothetical protein [Cyanobacteria bacterium UBA11166]HBS67987.1 hypothetical protein [Cyanobacteria bacterium UBA11153]